MKSHFEGKNGSVSMKHFNFKKNETNHWVTPTQIRKMFWHHQIYISHQKRFLGKVSPYSEDSINTGAFFVLA